jgi:hypothetical protein
MEPPRKEYVAHRVSPHVVRKQGHTGLSDRQN